jgi:AAA family ATP:ADP antiporter
VGEQSAYYVLKVVREGLTIGGVQLFGMGGDEIKAYLPALMALLLLGVVPAYGALASRVNRVRLLFQIRYLLLIALMILVTNVVNTTGEYILSNAAKS